MIAKISYGLLILICNLLFNNYASEYWVSRTVIFLAFPFNRGCKKKSLTERRPRKDKTKAKSW